MKGILADVNIQGYVDTLVARLQQEPWKQSWDLLQLDYFHFQDIGLLPETIDALVWEKCQELELFLVTDNRNEDDPSSLESTIRTRNTATSLPIFTIGDVRRLKTSRDYAHQVLDGMLAYLAQGDNLRGTGRLYLP